MGSKNYSRTWQRNSELLRQSSGQVSFDNFWKYSSFAGLYERPSPFSYRKEFPASKFAWSLTEVPNLLVSLLRLVRKSRFLERLGDYIWVRSFCKSTFGEAVVDLLPRKNLKCSDARGFFYGFSPLRLNGSYLKAAEQMYWLKRTLPALAPSVVVEIGAGHGAMADIPIKNLRPDCYVIIDLPEMLEISILWLGALADSVEKQQGSDGTELTVMTFRNTRVIFVDANEQDQLESVPVAELYLNSNSFAEMTRPVLERYLQLVSAVPGTVLFSANPRRHEGGWTFDPYSFANLATRKSVRILERPQSIAIHQSNVMTIDIFN